MNYQIFEPNSDLKDFVKCYWTLEIPAKVDVQKQRVIPDGYIEMIFHLADPVLSYPCDKKSPIELQAMILGHTIKPFYFEPTGVVDTFAVRFHSYSFAYFTDKTMKSFVNKALPLKAVFDNDFSQRITQKILESINTQKRISVVESLLFQKLKKKSMVDEIVKNTVDMLFLTKGNMSIAQILEKNSISRRQLERKFSQKIGLSPKQLGKIIRLQTALRMLLNHEIDSLTQLAYQAEYYDQAHFIKDFREFTGINPKTFFKDNAMEVSSIVYQKD